MVAILDDIVQAVKRKKELSTLDDSFVREKVKRVLEKEKKIKKKLEKAPSFREFSRSSEFKELKRNVREELHTVYGVFQKASKGTSPAERLASHQSSEERLAQYEEIYKRIFEITGKPGSILDLGCGANPYSYSFLGCRPTYIVMDLPSDDLKEIVAYFKKEAIEGEAFGIDLVKEYEKLRKLLGEYPVDVTFLFKLLDSLESIKRHISGKLLDAINATWLVVSFPTVSIGGSKHIKKERRAWFEKLLARRGWYYERFSISNEVFYVVLKEADALAEKRYGKRTGEDLLIYKQYNFEKEGEQLKRYVPKGKVLNHGAA